MVVTVSEDDGFSWTPPKWTNIWGFPSYAIEEAWKEKKLTQALNVFLEPMWRDFAFDRNRSGLGQRRSGTEHAMTSIVLLASRVGARAPEASTRWQTCSGWPIPGGSARSFRRVRSPR